MMALARGTCVLAALLVAAYGAARLRPELELSGGAAPLAKLIPARFGEWIEEPQPVSQVLLVPNAVENADVAQSASYDDVLMRTYRRADGARVMAAFAYGRRQTQEVKIHRPELCYYAQGFTVQSLGARAVRLGTAHSVQTATLLTRNRARVEIVTYWIRVGANLASGPWDMRWTIFREGMGGRVPDGLLVRASSLAESAAHAEQEIELQAAFLADLFREVPAATQEFLAGSAEVRL